MSPDNTCEKCHGRAIYRVDQFNWCQCDCVVEQDLQKYMNEIRPKEKWDLYPDLKNSLLYNLIKVGGEPGEYCIFTDPYDTKFEAFYAHLKSALRANFLKRLKLGQRPPKCRLIVPNDVCGVQFDKVKGHEEKKAELLVPDILILVAPTWVKFPVFWHELELLVKNRAQLGGNTWIVSNDFAKIKTYPDCPVSFHHFIDKVHGIKISKSDLPSLIKSSEKEGKKSVLSVKGLGTGGLDSKQWAPQDTRTTAFEKELDKHESDGNDG